VTGDVELTSDRLTVLRSTSPAQFDGPGDRWSPETLLVGAVADCFVLTFRAIATASNLSWLSLDCDVIGTLDRVERVTQFTRFDMAARLVLTGEEDADRARHLLEKAERDCLISRSLKGAIDLKLTIEVGEPAHLGVRAS
jgi:peroxiredoxin-like protein